MMETDSTYQDIATKRSLIGKNNRAWWHRGKKFVVSKNFRAVDHVSLL
jgi:hypothetical protein